MRKPRKPKQPSHEARELERLLTDPELLATAALLPSYRRASLWLVVREAVIQLRQAGRLCDWCSEPGRHLRFVSVPPGAGVGEGPVPVGVMIVCSRHVGHSRRSLRKKFQAKMRGRRPEEFPRFHDKPCIVGPRVGGLKGLPPRIAPQICRECGSPTWIKLSDEETLELGDAQAEYVCFDCAGPLVERGRLLAVPDWR